MSKLGAIFIALALAAAAGLSGWHRQISAAPVASALPQSPDDHPGHAVDDAS